MTELSPLTLQIKRLSHAKGLPFPYYATSDSAGLDLCAAVENPLPLEPGQRATIPTGFAIALPPGYEAQLRPRSGLCLKYGLTVLNSPGTIDADYRGEIFVILINHGSETIIIQHGMRIAQLLIMPVIKVQWQVTEELGTSSRGDRRFGSTGF